MPPTAPTAGPGVRVAGSSDGSGGAGTGSPGSAGGPSTPGGGGASGIKMWRGTPPPERPRARTRPRRPAGAAASPDSATGRGPVPLWGGPIPELDGDAASATGKGTREPRSFRHDDMGPVLLGDPGHGGGTVGGPGGADGEGGVGGD